MEGTFVVHDPTHDSTIIANKLRGFVASLFKFYVETGSCNWSLLDAELKAIQVKCDVLLLKIDQRQFQQHHLMRSRESGNRNTESVFDQDSSSSSSDAVNNNIVCSNVATAGNRSRSTVRSLNDEFDEIYGNLRRAQNYSDIPGLFDLE